MNVPKSRYILISESGIEQAETFQELEETTPPGDYVTYMRVYPLDPVLSETEALGRVCSRAIESRCTIICIAPNLSYLDVGMFRAIPKYLGPSRIEAVRVLNMRIDLRNGSSIHFETAASAERRLYGLSLHLAWVHGSVSQRLETFLATRFEDRPREIIRTY